MDTPESGTHWIYLGTVPNSIAELSDPEILDYIHLVNAEKDFRKNNRRQHQNSKRDVHDEPPT